MFEVVWPPIIGVMSQILETFDDSHMIQLCIEGFLHSIRLSCRLDLPISRNTFVNSLAKFTTLETVREMKQKNVLSIKLLMNIALSEGEYLEESWGQILQNISQLARLQLFANGSLTDDLFFSESALTSSSNEIKNNRRGNSTHNGTVKINFYDKQHSSDAFTKLFLGPSKAETTRLTEEANAEMVMRDIDPVQIDRVFLNSVSLSGESVGHFVKCLCEVSLLEISTSSSMNSLRGKDSSADSSTPRIFSLQKLVEVADCNMYSRSRIDWSNIWNLLARHFSSVGLHENQALAMYAIDSLKQLSIKFLQKEELSNFNFQRVFLKPFEVIMQRSKSIEIKDLILRCLDIMIKACSNNIHSGWRSIFAIFEVAAGQDSLEIANIAFEITEQLMDHFDLLVFDFVGIMNCLVAFVASTHTTLSLKALNYLSRCADHLAEGTINSIASTAESSINKGTPVHINEMNQINEDASVFRLWWPLLLGLSARVSDVRLQVRVKALNTLHSVLHNYGHLFSPQTWSVIFKGVLFPIVDSAKTDATIQPRSVFPTENPAGSTNAFSWIGTMGLNVLTVCLELYQKFKEKDDFVPLLPDLISMLESCICQDTESLAKMGLRVLNDLVLSMGKEKALMFKDGTSKNVVLLEGPHADLVCVRITKCMMKNICIEFGQLGSIKMNKKEIPIDIQKKYTSECPLALRKKSKEGNSTPQTNSSRRFSENNVRLESFNTPFGNGFFSEVLFSFIYLFLFIAFLSIVLSLFSLLRLTLF
jgi:brefeldin A-inhibited guanine nucleotide-exchange protein